MKWKMLLFAATLFLWLGSIGLADDINKKKLDHTPDSADLVPNSGRIILDGRLMEPPYEIVSDGYTIIINNVNIYRKPESTKVPVDTSLREQVEVLNHLFDYFNEWYYEVGFDSAQQLVVDYLKKQSVVDSVFFDKKSILKVQFRSQIWPETIMLEAPEELPGTPEQRTRDFLDRQVKHLNGCISNGKLLVITNGVIEYLNNCQKIIKKIKEIMDSESVLDGNKELALESLLGNQDAARAILKHWNDR